MYRNNREQATSKYIDYFKINIRRNINIHRLSPGREGKQNHRLPHIGARLRMERHDTRTCASFRASRRENKTRRRDFNGTNGHGNFAHRESDEERFEKLGRLLLTNEASLIENRLKFAITNYNYEGRNSRFEFDPRELQCDRYPKRFPLSRETQTRAAN